jgi:hypothetical protein
MTMCLASSSFGVVSAVIVDTASVYRRAAPVAVDGDAVRIAERSLRRWGSWSESKTPIKVVESLMLSATHGQRRPFGGVGREYSFGRPVHQSASPQGRVSFSVDVNCPHVGKATGVARSRESRTPVNMRN